MATTALTVQDIVRAGLTPSLVAAASGDGNVFDNAGRYVFLWVDNASGASIDVTIVTPGTADGLAITDRVVAVGAGVAKLIGPFPAMYEAYDSDNAIDLAIKITYSAVTSVTVGAFRVPKASV